MINDDDKKKARRSVSVIRAELVALHGEQQGFHYFAEFAPGIITDHLEGKSDQEILEKVAVLVAEGHSRSVVGRTYAETLAAHSEALNARSLRWSEIEAFYRRKGATVDQNDPELVELERLRGEAEAKLDQAREAVSKSGS